MKMAEYLSCHLYAEADSDTHFDEEQVVAR